MATCVVFFFFSSRRRHTRSYGDWSSDVCSSDLRDEIGDLASAFAHMTEQLRQSRAQLVQSEKLASIGQMAAARSEERRVGKECRARWSRDDEKKKGKQREMTGEQAQVMMDSSTS